MRREFTFEGQLVVLLLVNRFIGTKWRLHQSDCCYLSTMIYRLSVRRSGLSNSTAADTATDA